MKTFSRIIFPVILTLVLTNMTAVSADAQNEKVTIDKVNARMSEVMESIESQTKWLFAAEKGIDLDAIVTVKVNSAPVKTALDQMVSGTQVTYRFKGNNIFLTRRPQVVSPERKMFTVSGTISDDATGETLIGAAVTVGQTGAVTNSYGFYTLTIPRGEYILDYQYIGYSRQSVNTMMDADTVINIHLQPSEELKASRVVGRKDAGILSTRTGSIVVPMNIIANTPVVLGEPDVLKTLQMMPGIQAGTEGFTGIHVRGGGADENLMLLDGVPIYNVSHMLGIFSVFTPEAVKNVTVYKSAFPARYSGRVSSVVDVVTNDGNSKEFHGLVSVGYLTDKVHLEGPLGDGKTTYSLSLRGAHSVLAEPLMRLFNAGMNYYFYDTNLKLTHRFNDSNTLSATFYKGLDDLWYDAPSHKNVTVEKQDYTRTTKTVTYERVKMRWGNTVAAVKWNHVFTGQLFSTITTSWNRYRMNIATDTDMKTSVTATDIPTVKNTENDDAYAYRSGIEDLGARIDFDYTPVPSQMIRFGGEYIRHIYTPEQNTMKQKDMQGTTVTTDTVMHSSAGARLLGSELSFYAEDDFSLGEHLSFDPGVHMTIFNTQGKTYISAEPRISAKCTFGNGYAIKAAYSRMSQYVHLLTSTAWSLPTDLWVPITKDIKPILSDQYSIGAYYSGLEGWEFSLEGYLKNIDNVLEYKNMRVAFTNSSSWDKSVEMGEGRSFGGELFVQKTSGSTTGWLAYTLAKSDRIFRNGTINDGKRFPYTYDRRHDLTLCLNHKFSSRIDASASWSYQSGAAMTVPTRQTVVVYPEGYTENVLYYEGRNNYRLPASHHLDLSVNFRKQKRHGERIWNIGIYNVYAARNPNWVVVDYEEDNSTRQMKTSISERSFLTFLPSFSYTFRF